MVSHGTLGLVGAGGHGKVAAEIAMAAGWDDIVFFDRAYPERVQHGAWPILDREPNGVSTALFCSVGGNEDRERLFKVFGLDSSPVLRHPSAVVSPSATLGAGTLVVAGAIINADAHVGRGVILNTASSIDHDCVIDDFVHISPGVRLAGGVCVGARSWIGIGAVIREGITLGSDVLVGAGAVVVSDIPDRTWVSGVPARPMREGEPTC